ncbi:B12-binding domain-containing radical SAM protein [Patescibacteria group bacterium]|nr:B12-binding domain-containing radical SAM protein [Patescibacteria group bacterium]
MSFKVLLFNGPIVETRTDKLEMESRILRLGIASIAAYLRDNQVEVSIVDPVTQAKKDIESILCKLNPVLTGLHAYTSEIHDAAATAQWIKSVIPATKVIIGGPHASAIPRETLQEFSSFDIAVIGEGEQTMLEVSKNINRLAEIPGISYRSKSNIQLNSPRKLIENIDKLPYPDWQLFDLQKYKGSDLIGGFGKKTGSMELPVEGARGCPFSCIFCFRTMGRTVRFKSPQRIVDEVQRNVEVFGANKIHFIEGTFAINKMIASEMCQELIRRNLHKKITWSSGGRVDVLDEKLLILMKQSGCDYLGIGVESGDQKILDIIGKKITIEQIKRAFDLCRKVGITTEAEFILGHPFETEATIKKTISLARSLPAKYATFAILVPFPGTEIVEMARNNVGGLKVLTKDWHVYGKQIGQSLELEQLPHEKLLEYQAMAYNKFYLRPSHITALISRLNKERVLYGIRNLFRELT